MLEPKLLLSDVSCPYMTTGPPKENWLKLKHESEMFNGPGVEIPQDTGWESSERKKRKRLGFCFGSQEKCREGLPYRYLYVGIIISLESNPFEYQVRLRLINVNYSRSKCIRICIILYFPSKKSVRENHISCSSWETRPQKENYLKHNILETEREWQLALKDPAVYINSLVFGMQINQSLVV